MTVVMGRGKEIIGGAIDLGIDSERIHGAPIDISNFEQYILEHASDQIPINSLDDPIIPKLAHEEVQSIHWHLVKAQIKFAYNTTPAIKYLWDLYGIRPERIRSLDMFRSNVLPITKNHQRLLGWMNFLPAPIASYILDGRECVEDINPNLILKKRKWTGGTSALDGDDYVYIQITNADWRASVQTMTRIVKPILDELGQHRYAATTYDRRHIAEPLFEDQLKSLGINLLSKPAGASDKAFFQIMRENEVNILVAPPIDHPAKGQGIPGALKEIANQLDVVLMSSATPNEQTLRILAENNIAVLNVGGDTGSLPTYYSSCTSITRKHSKAIEQMKCLQIIQVAPALTEVVNPRNLSPSDRGTWGVLLQTNTAALWENGRFVKGPTGKLWVPDGTTRLVPALKSQTIRSSATGNLVFVLDLTKDGNVKTIHHLILRYNDFELDKDLLPTFDFPRSSGGSATGGCAA